MVKLLELKNQIPFNILKNKLGDDFQIQVLKNEKRTLDLLFYNSKNILN